MKRLMFLLICIGVGAAQAEQPLVQTGGTNLKEARYLLQKGHDLNRSGDIAGAIEQYELALAADPNLTAASLSLEGARSDLAIERWGKANMSEECRQTDENAKVELLLTCATEYFSIYGQPIHPSIIEALQGWMSDTGEQVVAVNIIDAQDSNWVCCADIQLIESSGFFYVHNDDGGSFYYKRIGVTDSGLHLLHTVQNTGGSGQFNGVLLVSISLDTSLNSSARDEVEEVLESTSDRLLVRNIGYIVLGDRWDGQLKVEGDALVVGPDQGWFSGREGYEREGRRILIDYP